MVLMMISMTVIVFIGRGLRPSVGQGRISVLLGIAQRLCYDIMVAQ